MRKICIINQKGGVGKTTSTVNLAAGLSRNGRKVLIVDFDAQGNIASSLHLEGDRDIFHVLTENADIRQCTLHLGKNLDVITSRETLTKTEVLLAQMPDKEFVLKKKLADVKDYDYILIDCPPSLGILNQNALLYAEEAFIPVSTDYLGYDALIKMTKVIEKINDTFGKNIRITKVIPTLFDKRNKTCRHFLEKITSQFYETATSPIRINSKLKEAPSAGKSIFAYAASSRGAKDYARVVQTIINEEEKVLSEYSEGDLIPLNSAVVLEQYHKN